MSWYWIILIIFIYLVGWGAMGGIADRLADDTEFSLEIGILWPVVLPLLIGFLIFAKKKNEN